MENTMHYLFLSSIFFIVSAKNVPLILPITHAPSEGQKCLLQNQRHEEQRSLIVVPDFQILTQISHSVLLTLFKFKWTEPKYKELEKLTFRSVFSVILRFSPSVFIV